MDFTRAAVMMTYSYTGLFLLCYYGDKVTSTFEDLRDFIYLSDWQLFPLEMQKYMPIMLMFAHEMVYMHAFAEIHCTLQTFEQVIFISYCFLHYFKIHGIFRLLRPHTATLQF